MSIKKQYTFSYLIPVFFFCLLGSLSCVVTNAGRTTDLYRDKTSQKPQIIFLNYSIKLDRSDGDIKIHLVNKIITEGKLKINNPEHEISKPGDLLCIPLNSKLEPFDSIIIADPLNITVESVDENNSLFKKEITRDSAQFSVRLQLNEEIQSVAIKKNSISDDKNSYLLITKIREP